MAIQTNLFPISLRGFDQLIAIAKTMKNCAYHFVDSRSRILYGIYNESIIRTMSIPPTIELPIDLKFKISNIDIDIVNTFKDFIYNPLSGILTAPASDEVTIDLKPQNSFEYLMFQKVTNIIYKYRTSIQTISPIPSIFGDMENYPVIQEVQNSKVTDGVKYLELTGMNGKKYGFVVYRGLFSLNKGDRLSIRIYDKIDDGRLFMVRFLVEKKKSPIPTIIPHYIEQTDAMYINMCNFVY